MFKNIFGMKKTSTKIMYLCYCTLGGIIKSPFISRSLKYFWITYNVIAFVLMHISIIDYIRLALTDSSPVPLDIVIALHALLSMLAAYTTFFAYIVTFHFRQNLEKIMTFLDNENEIFAGIRDIPSNKDIDGLYTVGNVLEYQFFSAVLVVMYFTIRPARVLFYGKNIQALRNVYSYFYCARYIYQISSFKEYTILYLLQLTTVVLVFLPLTMLSVFNSSVVFELHNKFVKLRAIIGRYTVEHLQGIEKIHHLEMNAADNDKLKNLQVRLAAQVQMQALNVRFNKRMIKCVQCHQRLVASTNFFKTYIEIFFSLFLPFVTIIITTEGILLMTGGEEKSTLLDFGILLVEVAVGVLKYCHMGMLLQQMNEIVADEIYNTAWFEMPALQRKLVQRFLGQSQKQVSFFALKVFPMLLPTFPAMLRTAFSIVQVVSKVRR